MAAHTTVLLLLHDGLKVANKKEIKIKLLAESATGNGRSRVVKFYHIFFHVRTRALHHQTEDEINLFRRSSAKVIHGGTNR